MRSQLLIRGVSVYSTPQDPSYLYQLFQLIRLPSFRFLLILLMIHQFVRDTQAALD